MGMTDSPASSADPPEEVPVSAPAPHNPLDPPASPNDLLAATDPPARRGPLSTVRLDAIAMLGAELIPAEKIAAQVGVPVATVNRLLNGGSNERFDAIYEGYRDKRTRAVTQFMFRLYELHEDSFRAIQDALHGTDNKLRAETAWKVFDRTMPQLRERASGDGGDLHLHLPPGTQDKLIQATVEISSFLGSRESETALEDRLRRHIRVGTDALPTPPAQLAVEIGPAGDPADAPVEPTDFIEVDDD